MSRIDEHVEELFAFYALGTLTAAERSQVEAYIASDPDAKARLEEMLRTVSALPHGAPAVHPSAALKERLMGRVREDARTRLSPAPPPARASQSRSAWLSTAGSGSARAYAVAVMSLLLVLAVGIWGLAARNEVTRLRAQVAVLEQEVQSQRTVLVQLSLPQAHTFAIAGTEHRPQAQGQLIADSKTGSGVLVVSGLEPLGTGSTYEFWLIKDTLAVPAGLFKVNSEGLGVLQVTKDLSPGSYDAIGVSIEPNGGSPEPTGDIVMLGKID